jgi:CRP-like cAMP-binding protein
MPFRLPFELGVAHYEASITATLRAVTPCRVAVVPKDRIDRQALEKLVKGGVPRIGRQTLERSPRAASRPPT